METSNPSTAVGVLGLGIIGSRVAANLREQGRPVYVWSRTVRPIPNFMPDPAAVADACHTLQIFVRDGAALHEAMENLRPALTPHHLVMNHATVLAEDTRRAAQVCEETGARFLDAPFTGSKMAAQNAKLVYYVSGEADHVALATPLLRLSGEKVLPMGAIGNASVVKVATNLLSAVTVKALEEAMRMTQAQGVDLEHLKTAFESNANYSTLVGMKFPAMAAGDFDPHFSLSNMLKDVEFARRMAGEQGARLECGDEVAAAMTRLQDAGLGDADFSVLGRAVHQHENGEEQDDA